MNFRTFRITTMSPAKTYPGRHPLLRNWVIYGMQYPAVPFSYLFSKFGITANQVSILRVLICLFSLPLFMGNTFSIFLGIFLYYFALVSDCIDGQLARFYKTQSLEGAFVDSVTSAFLSSGMYLALGLTAYEWSGSLFGLILAVGIIWFKGLSGNTKNLVLMKLLFSPNTSLSVEDRGDEDKTIPGETPWVKRKEYTYPKDWSHVLHLLWMDNHFQIPRVALVYLLAVSFGNSLFLIYLFLGVCFAFVVKAEIRTSRAIYRGKTITKFINGCLPIFEKESKNHVSENSH